MAGRASGVRREPPRDRPSYLIWEEGKAPDFVLEVASPSTADRDAEHKAREYAQIGVREYWRLDPQGTLMGVPLEGYEATGEKYDQVQPVASRACGRWFRSGVLGAGPVEPQAGRRADGAGVPGSAHRGRVRWHAGRKRPATLDRGAGFAGSTAGGNRGRAGGEGGRAGGQRGRKSECGNWRSNSALTRPIALHPSATASCFAWALGDTIRLREAGVLVPDCASAHSLEFLDRSAIVGLAIVTAQALE